MDQEFVKALNMMEVDVVIIKGKIAGIKKPVEIVMDQTTFNEWKEKLQAKAAPGKKLSFGKAFMGEAGKLLSGSGK